LPVLAISKPFWGQAIYEKYSQILPDPGIGINTTTRAIYSFNTMFIAWASYKMLKLGTKQNELAEMQ